MGPDISLQTWIGRSWEAEDIVTPRLIASYNAMLAPHLAAAPLGLHWCLAPDIAEASQLGPDGHPTKGSVLPPVPLPRRMWAGSDIHLLGAFAVGDTVHRRSTIVSIQEKHGRSGQLVFVTVRHEMSNAGAPVVEEDQIIVYKQAADPRASATPGPSAMPVASHERKVAVDPILLFRYSALTFNGHRIHYDFPYATGVEHYPGLVIHGPLQATLLLNFAAMVNGRPPRRFSFRGTLPATGTQTLTLRAEPNETGDLSLEVQAAEGLVSMKAVAQW
ncbi:MAG: MaoC family dehydratase N-terminal domain-containing protein [Hyphomicrobiales bacterium]|nr:MaoC family dehydratase N-terminal domain-containing protein [Hyphomicrobiales bacterium]